ncbi:MAG: diphthine synthase [Candidatus Aenigmarchaeota archaeon]|nr:diphthine synthase [Candidatus Aenigmarchaeota archaeon]
MLFLISLGLSDEKDMSLKALEAAKKCDMLYAEFYTNRLETDVKKLSKLVGKEVKEIARSDLEEKSGKLIEEAKTKNVGIFVGGDALSATTHASIILDAKKAGVEAKIIHGSSIFSAVAETGLHLYKFGATTTLCYPEKNYFPTSCYETILENKKLSLHTLILLDVKPDKCMSIKDGFEVLLDIEKQKGKKLVTENTFFVAASNLGSEKQKVKYGKLKDLAKQSFGTPAILVLPGDLHFSEKEFLEHL